MQSKCKESLFAAGLFACLLFSAACTHQENRSTEAVADSTISEATFIEDILFARADTAALRLNIAIPAGEEMKYPLLIFIHGGGWQTGHRSAYNTQIQEAATRGFVAATISHRYTRTVNEQGKPIYRWPAPLHDVKAAVRFLRAHADSFRIDPDRIGALGASSGAHLAMMLGFTDPKSGLEGSLSVPGDDDHTVSTRIHAVANLSGPTEMVSSYEAPVVTPYLDALMDGSPQEHPEKYRTASPVHHLSSDDPPVLTIHGRLDDVVPVEQARILNSEMRKTGISHEFVLLEDQGHIFDGSAEDESWEKVYQFFMQAL